MSSVTEMVTFRIQVPREEAAAASTELLETVLAKAPGFQNAFSGFRLEDPDMLHWFVNWDCLESHNKFMATPEYDPFVQKVLKFSGFPQLWHSSLTSMAPMTAPVTEWATVYLKPSADRNEWAKGLDVLEEVAGRTAPGYKGMSRGWVTENGHAMTLMIGWESKEAHLDWKSSCDEVPKAMAAFRVPEVQKVDMFHVKIDGEVQAPA